MKNIFEHSSYVWVHYNDYVWKKASDGHFYLTPADNAVPQFLDSLTDPGSIVVDALKIGRMCMKKLPDRKIMIAIREFAVTYGLLGIMTALPTTTDFLNYDAVYLPVNMFIREEVLPAEKYLAHFFPFGMPVFKKNGKDTSWEVEGDNTMTALIMAMSDRPAAEVISFHRLYAERYDWLKKQFTDWVFIFSTVFLYYEDQDRMEADIKRFYQESMAAFNGTAPTYHIALLEKPTLIWNFHSLLSGIQMMLFFMLTDDHTPLKLCRNCMMPFVAKRPNAVFCSEECRKSFYKKTDKK